MLYLDEETLLWAQATGEGKTEENSVKHIDSNGKILEAGDTVSLVKDLVVKELVLPQNVAQLFGVSHW